MMTLVAFPRWPCLFFLAIGLQIAGACLGAYPYVPLPRDRRAATARIVTTGLTSIWGPSQKHNAVLDVYEFRGSCPDLGFRRQSQGYRGALYINGDGTGDLALPAGEAIVLRAEWEDRGKWGCSAALATFLDERKLYVVRFARDGKTGNCDMDVAEAVAQAGTFYAVAAAPSIKLVGPWQGTPHATCTAAGQLVKTVTGRQ
jgi:hypothetical protein